MSSDERRKEPQSTRFRSIAPMLTVNDLAASLAWYTEIMGFYLADEWKDADGKRVGASLKAGAADLMLNQDDFAKGKERQKGVAVRLYCMTAQDLDQLAEAISSRGGELDHAPTTRPWGARDFAVTDPDGFKLTITAPDPG